MARTIYALFHNKEQADKAINALQIADYSPQDLSIILKNNDDKVERTTTTGENIGSGAASGATTGAVVGGLAGLLIGIGAITIPGIGALLIGGPIASALGLSGAAAVTAEGAITGALAGGLLGALIGLGIPEEKAKVYEESIKQGGVLLAIPLKEKDGENAVKDILEKNGAENIISVEK